MNLVLHFHTTKSAVLKSQVTRRVVVGGGLQVHNHATSWPSLQDGICKNSILVEFQVGPECGKNRSHSYYSMGAADIFCMQLFFCLPPNRWQGNVS